MLNAQDIRHRSVTSQEPRRRRQDAPHPQIATRRQLAHAAAEGLEPGERMRRPVREAPQPQGLDPEGDILDHHALFGRDAFRHQPLELLHRDDALGTWIIQQMPATTARKALEARWTEASTFVHHKGSRRLIENRQQAIDIDLGQIIDRQEIRRHGVVEGPLVAGKIAHGLTRCCHTPLAQPHAATPVQFNVVLLLGAAHQVWDLRRGKILGRLRS